MVRRFVYYFKFVCGAMLELSRWFGLWFAFCHGFARPLPHIRRSYQKNSSYPALFSVQSPLLTPSHRLFRRFCIDFRTTPILEMNYSTCINHS